MVLVSCKAVGVHGVDQPQGGRGAMQQGQDRNVSRSRRQGRALSALAWQFGECTAGACAPIYF